MLGKDHANLSEGKRQGASNVHAMSLEIPHCPLAEAENFRYANDLRSGTGSNCSRIPDMIAMGVADKDVIALHILRLDGRCRIPRKKGICQNLVLAIIQKEACMTVIGKLHHFIKSFLPSYCSTHESMLFSRYLL